MSPAPPESAAVQAPPESTAVFVAHGTADPRGQREVADLVDLIRSARPGLDVRVAYVDVQQPTVAEVVAQAAVESRPVVVVPLLLSDGYHTRVDIGAAVAGRPTVQATGPLGPEPVLAEVLADRLVGWRPGDTVVLAATGSREPQAAIQVQAMAALLAQQLAQQLTQRLGVTQGAPPSTMAANLPVGYLTATPRIADVVAANRRGGRVLVASYLLAPGLFQDRLADCGADLVADPLGADPRVAAVALARFDRACAAITDPQPRQ